MSGYGRIKRLFTSKDLRIPYTKTAEDIRLAADPEANDKILDYFKESGAYLPLPGGRQAFFVNTIKRVHKVAVPTLVIWGEKDELDPVASGKLLYEKLTCIKSLEIVAENGHVGFVDSNREKVMNLTAKWLQTYLPPIPKVNEMIGRVPNF